MDPRPSYSVAPGDRRRDRILPRGGILGLVGIAVVGLVLVFPKRDILSLLRNDNGVGNRELTIAYLRNIIGTDPRDLNLRFLLVEKLVNSGDLAGARQALADAQPLVKGNATAEALWAQWDLAWWQARYRQVAGGADTAAQAAASTEIFNRLQTQIAAVNQPARVFALIRSLRQLQPAPAQVREAVLSLLRRLLAMKDAPMADLSQGAQMALAEGDYQAAADLYFAARRRTAQTDAQDRLLQLGAKALLASGQPLVAYQAAVREAGTLPEGDPLNWFLVDLALGAGQAREAAAHLQRVVPAAWDAATAAKKLTPEQLRTAYDTFAAAADLPQALKLAQAALVQKPGDTEWLERYAQVSEWTGQGAQALAAWVQLMAREAGTRALDNVFRLSPMLYDDDALLAAWNVLQRRRALSDEEVARVVDVYERLGQVDGALAFLDRVSGDGLPHSRLPSLKAALLDRAGRPREAIAVLESLRPAGLQRDDAVRLAQLHLKQGNQPFALRALLAIAAPPSGATFDQTYWDLVADIAWETGQRPTARNALDQLVARGTLKPYQAARAVRIPLDAGENGAARVLAAQLYPRAPTDELVFTWLDALDTEPQAAQLQQLLAALKPEHRERLERRAEFLERRAALYTRLGDRPAALRDYRQALARQPALASARIAYWWLLVDMQDEAALRTELARQFARVRNDSGYAEVLAATLQLLDQPRLALTLLAPQARANANNFLWLMNYADVLERAGRAAPALRVRRHAWLLANRAAAKPADAAQARDALLTQLRLASAFAGGAQKDAWQQQLATLLRAPAGGAPSDAARQRQLADVASAWLLSEGRFDAAARWLWRQQAQRIATPAYQAVALALADGDDAQLERLLEQSARATGQSPQRLDIQDEMTALRQLGRYGQAAAAGVALGQRRAEGLDDDTQQPVQDDLLRGASRASVQALHRTTGGLARTGVVADASIALTPKLRLTAELTSWNNRATDATLIGGVPAHDRLLRAGVEAQTPWGDVVAQVLARDALASVKGLFLQLTRKLDSRATLVLQAARAEPTDDSTALSLAGVRDRLAASLAYRIGQDADLQASLARNRYRTQTGAALGSSSDAAVSGNWYVRRDYPDVRVQASLRRSRIRADGQPDAPTAALYPGNTLPPVDFFLGQDTTALSVTLGIGLSQSDPAVYSHAWRPWGEIGFETRRSATPLSAAPGTPSAQATQGLLRLGAKGTVAGRDQLSIHLDLRPSPPGQPSNAGSRELRVQYQTFFDR